MIKIVKTINSVTIHNFLNDCHIEVRNASPHTINRIVNDYIEGATCPLVINDEFFSKPNASGVNLQEKIRELTEQINKDGVSSARLIEYFQLTQPIPE